MGGNQDDTDSGGGPARPEEAPAGGAERRSDTDQAGRSQDPATEATTDDIQDAFGGPADGSQGS